MRALELQQQADAQLEVNDILSAKATLEKLSVLTPGDLNVLNKLAWAYMTLGDSHNAINICEKMLELNPNATDANYYLAMVYGKAGDMPKVRRYLSRVLHHDANNINALLKLAYVDYIEGKTVSSLSLLMKVRKLDPQNIELNIRLGRHYTTTNEFDKAKKFFGLALKSDAENTEAISQLASLYAYGGDPDKALSLIQPYLDDNIIDISIAIVLAEICRPIQKCDEAKKYLEIVLKSDLDNLSKSSVLFALGKLYDRDKEYDLSFNAYDQANKLSNFAFDAWEERQTVLAIREKLTEPFIKQLPKAKKLGKFIRPIFIVGMPRSGTSLVEQVLSSHKLVHGAGERMEMSTIASSLQSEVSSLKAYPFCIVDTNTSLLTSKAKQYLKDISRDAPDNVKFVTDKMPDNYKHLLLIQQLFPKAKVIHCVRNPMDNCLSCYFTQLMGHAYSYNLESLGTHYGLYKVVMDHWKKVLQIPVMNVQYEDMVHNVEQTSREILEFCGLDWDDACLSFHESKRSVITASSDQVRQPIYTKSVERWRNYEAHLVGLKKSLNRSI